MLCITISIYLVRVLVISSWYVSDHRIGFGRILRRAFCARDHPDKSVILYSSMPREQLITFNHFFAPLTQILFFLPCKCPTSWTFMSRGRSHADYDLLSRILLTWKKFPQLTGGINKEAFSPTERTRNDKRLGVFPLEFRHCFSCAFSTSDVIKSVFRKGSDETFISSLEALGKDQ